VRTALPKTLIVLFAAGLVATIGSRTLGEALESPTVSTAMSLVLGGGIGVLLLVLVGWRHSPA
jgi:ABC-type proline/glycine betaine transport system permease subunit